MDTQMQCAKMGSEAHFALWDAFEHKGIKKLTPDQLLTFLQRIEVQVTELQVKAIVKRIGVDTRGCVAAADFCKWLSTCTFTAKDVAAVEEDVCAERSYTLLSGVSFHEGNCSFVRNTREKPIISIDAMPTVM
eukprot:TRINITY_DN49851_c0_g1_i1.p1 TRINITY_DN49851_c0_g1~~TRINITY_DN49851_c0_g1_i1.p1  ORF type:complete len:133 (-),score=20.20 TRINITY_DN49851_c0_g1_i1:502-900(-)